MTTRYEVTTICGSGADKCQDGIGSDVSLSQPFSICAVPGGDESMLIAEIGSNRIRRFDYTRHNSIGRALRKIFMSGPALIPIQPLVSLIAEYAAYDGMIFLAHSPIHEPSSDMIRVVMIPVPVGRVRVVSGTGQTRFVAHGPALTVAAYDTPRSI